MIAASLALNSTASAEPSDQRESTQAQADPGPIAASTGHPDQSQTTRVQVDPGSIEASAEPSDQSQSTQAQADPSPIADSTGHPDQSQTTRLQPGSGSIATGTGETIPGDIFPTMMEYQKLINREGREDRKLSSGDARLRVRIPDGPQKSKLSICEAAKLARDRNSPAAPGLAKQCLDSGDSVPQ